MSAVDDAIKKVVAAVPHVALAKSVRVSDYDWYRFRGANHFKVPDSKGYVLPNEVYGIRTQGKSSYLLIPFRSLTVEFKGDADVCQFLVDGSRPFGGNVPNMLQRVARKQETKPPVSTDIVDKDLKSTSPLTLSPTPLNSIEEDLGLPVLLIANSVIDNVVKYLNSFPQSATNDRIINDLIRDGGDYLSKAANSQYKIEKFRSDSTLLNLLTHADGWKHLRSLMFKLVSKYLQTSNKVLFDKTRMFLERGLPLPEVENQGGDSKIKVSRHLIIRYVKLLQPFCTPKQLNAVFFDEQDWAIQNFGKIEAIPLVDMNGMLIALRLEGGNPRYSLIRGKDILFESAWPNRVVMRAVMENGRTPEVKDEKQATTDFNDANTALIKGVFGNLAVKQYENRVEWFKRGGYAGTIDRIVKNAKALGFRLTMKHGGGDVDGTMLGSSFTYKDKHKNQLKIRKSIGSKQAQNSFSVVLRFAADFTLASVVASIVEAAKSVPKDDDDKPGTYAAFSLAPETDRKLRTWALDKFGKQYVTAHPFHVTTVYSKTHIDYTPNGKLDEPLVIKPDTFAIKIFGRDEDSKVAVLNFKSAYLTKCWEKAKAAGLKWDFPSYEPHVTLTKGVPEGFDPNSVGVPDFPLELTEEFCEDLDEDWNK